mmetsp:Transcript_8864/g.16133  ORF Transcript_8864/g.16133 Transcript_8864/m.16133 type:complete len:273 (-) Transcript_8864:224-1042(-)
MLNNGGHLGQLGQREHRTEHPQRHDGRQKLIFSLLQDHLATEIIAKDIGHNGQKYILLGVNFANNEGDGDARWGPHAFVVVFNDAVENVGLAFGESAVDAKVDDVVKEDRDGFQGTGVVGNVKDVLNAVKVAAVTGHALIDEDGPGLEFGRGESVIAGSSERHQTALERLDQLDNVRVVRERGLPRHARLAILVRHIGRHIQAEQMLAYLQRRRHLRVRQHQLGVRQRLHLRSRRRPGQTLSTVLPVIISILLALFTIVSIPAPLLHRTQTR